MKFKQLSLEGFYGNYDFDKYSKTISTNDFQKSLYDLNINNMKAVSMLDPSNKGSINLN